VGAGQEVLMAHQTAVVEEQEVLELEQHLQ
jgi:hypothetical protein